MSFYSQRNRAYAQAKNVQFLQNRPSSKNASLAVDDPNSFADRLANSPYYQKGFGEAYSSPSGYSIRKNPYTGEVEMFVRGTTFKRGGAEWAQNLLESPVGAMVATPWHALSKYGRERHSNYLSKIARDKGVDVIYGHSRGAAIVVDMNVPGATKVGVDGAMMLTKRRYQGNMVNYRQSQFFDAAIGMGARRTYKRRQSWRQFHSFYGK